MLDQKPDQLEKVAIIITRILNDTPQFLLLHRDGHKPEFPGGTVDKDESLLLAAVRKSQEEAGVSQHESVTLLGSVKEFAPENTGLTLHGTKVYHRPDTTTNDTCPLRRGLLVNVLKRREEFAQISYVDYGDDETKVEASFSILGWVPSSALVGEIRRHFYHIETSDDRKKWTTHTESTDYNVRWHDFDHVPEIAEYQEPWLALLPRVKARLLAEAVA